MLKHIYRLMIALFALAGFLQATEQQPLSILYDKSRNNASKREYIWEDKRLTDEQQSQIREINRRQMEHIASQQKAALHHQVVFPLNPQEGVCMTMLHAAVIGPAQPRTELIHTPFSKHLTEIELDGTQYRQAICEMLARQLLIATTASTAAVHAPDAALWLDLRQSWCAQRLQYLDRTNNFNLPDDVLAAIVGISKKSGPIVVPSPKYPRFDYDCAIYAIKTEKSLEYMDVLRDPSTLDSDFIKIKRAMLISQWGALSTSERFREHRLEEYMKELPTTKDINAGIAEINVTVNLTDEYAALLTRRRAAYYKDRRPPVTDAVHVRLRRLDPPPYAANLGWAHRGEEPESHNTETAFWMRETYWPLTLPIRVLPGDYLLSVGTAQDITDAGIFIKVSPASLHIVAIRPDLLTQRMHVQTTTDASKQDVGVRRDGAQIHIAPITAMQGLGPHETYIAVPSSLNTKLFTNHAVVFGDSAVFNLSSEGMKAPEWNIYLGRMTPYDIPLRDWYSFQYRITSGE